jgi:hypothetical protein
MTEPALTLWVSYRRDAILLTATALSMAAWGWSRNPLVMAFAGVACALLYAAVVAVVRHAQRLEQEISLPTQRGASLVWWITVLLSGAGALALLTTATYDAFEIIYLTVAVGVLVLAWLVWFYFWLGDSST